MKEKAKFVKEIKSAAPVNTEMMSKQNSFIAGREKVSVVWRENSNQPPRSPKPKPHPEQGANSPQLHGGWERGGRCRGWITRSRRPFCITQVQGEAAGADVGAAASYPEDLAKVMSKGSCSQQIFNIDEKASIGRFSEPERSQHLASKDTLTLLAGANVAGDLKLMPMFICRLENSRPLKNYIRSTLPRLCE